MLIVKVTVWILLCCTMKVSSKGYQHFSGGSMSYTVIENNVTGKLEAHIDMLTGWALGKGPCGPSCSESDVGKNTMNERRAIEKTYNDPFYFGNWSTETGPAVALIPADVNDEVKRNMKGHTIAISEIGKWEQEQMSTVIELNPSGFKEDIVYEGYSWRELRLQKHATHDEQDGKWHLQSKIDVRKRSDTGTQNASPTAFVKPFYRVKLNSITQITIPAMDTDDDIVKCTPAYSVEGGILSNFKLPGLTVDLNCTVTLNTSTSLNYKDDTWGGVALTVRDYNRETIDLNGTKSLANSFAIGGATVQFLVQVLEHLHQPEFVSPTDPSNHHFYLYAGTTWNVDLFAKSSENTTITEFLVLGRQDEIFQMSEIKEDKTGRDRVKFITVSWEPAINALGSHIICVRAIDNTGVDTADDRCFIIKVKDEVFHATNRSSDKPYFVDLPSYNETVGCNIDSTCVFPIYVNSTSKIVDVKIEASFEFTRKGPISSVIHNGDSLYKMELSLMHNEDGQHMLCLTAIDENGVSSQRECIHSEIIATDPCISAPCKNSATCLRRANDTADYECKCIDTKRFEGKNCDRKQYHDCDPSPCGPGKCNQRPTGGFVCICRHTGFTGRTCSVNEDDCTPDPCHGHGICKDGIQNKTCACYGRYNGSSCDNDTCPLEPNGQLHCSGESIPGCNPDPCSNGKCISGGNCVCPLAYKSDSNCSGVIGDVSQSHKGITIVSPTLVDRSDIVCYKHQQCPIQLYIASPNSTSPNLRVESISEDLQQSIHIEQPSEWIDLTGIQKLYISNVTILPLSEGHKFTCLVVSDTHTEDRRCFSLTVKENPEVYSKSPEYKKKNVNIKFLDPTPNSNTRFVCYNDTQYHLLMYTTKPSTGQCETIISSEDDVHVFDPTITSSDDCQTELSYTFTTFGTHHICFQSSPNSSQSQLRCFDFAVQSIDPCSNSLCQNNAECFFGDGGARVQCVCKPDYTGTYCEKGPCLPSDDVCSNGYCYVDDHNKTCMCPIGFNGPNCSHSLPDSVVDPYINAAVFTDTARIRSITCVRNRPCPMSFISSGRFTNPDRPNVSAGYVHPSITILDLYTDMYTPGSFLTSAVIQGKKTGVNDLCIQILNKDRVNKDEVCIKVTVTEERSTVWTEKVKPHFVIPSLPPNTDLTCIASSPCHVIFYATPGEHAASTECVELHVKSDVALRSHISSPCDNCSAVPNNKNCTFDLVMFPDTKIEICITAVASISKESGEKRCYDVTVDQQIAPSGCQTLHCLNGGFCDGHGDAPVCHCPLPYEGTNCGTDTSLSGSSNAKTFVGQMGLPQVVKCYTNSQCEVPFGIGGFPSNISMGYVSPGLEVHLSNGTTDPSTKQQTDSVIVTPSTSGKHRYCLQMINSSSVDDELCITVVVEDGPEPTPETTKPYFLQPTLPKDSLILCEADKACHLDLHFTNGSLFNSALTCPSIIDTNSDGVEGVHIHPSVKNPTDCSSDISYIPPTGHTGNDELLCFEVGLPSVRGEKRCFNIHIAADALNEVSRPCASQICKNGAKCIADFSDGDTSLVDANCVCTKGYSGTECSTVVPLNDHLRGVEGINATTSPNYTSEKTPHFDSEAGLPVAVKCEVNKECLVYIPYKGQQGYPPVQGHMDAGFNVTDTSVITSGNDSHVKVFKLSGQQTGNGTMCVQTTTGGEKQGVNIDETCFKVEMLPAGSLNQPPTQDLGNVPDNTTISCDTDSICHLTVISNSTNGCPDIKECGTGVPGLQMYSPKPPSGVCVTDIAVRTKNEETEQDLCITTGSGNDEKHITLRTTGTPDHSPCQKLHCINGGFCDNEDGTATCKCVNSYSGLQCELDPCTTPLPIVSLATHPNYTAFPNGLRVNYTCNYGYQFSNANANGYTCVSQNNSWSGDQPKCIPKQLCDNDSDCLNGGSCSSKICICAARYKNSNCDTPVCSKPQPRRHSNFVLTGLPLFVDGYNATYKCDQGYKATANSSFIYKCNTTTDVWQGDGLFCIAKERCDNDGDCLNSGKCQSNKCNCTTGFGNSNCDTVVCDRKLPSVVHAKPNLSNAIHTNGSEVVYACEPGYTIQNGSPTSVVCNAPSNTWDGQPANCTAIQTCTRDEDCLNGGSCDVPSKKCNCKNGWGNSNCDTAVCSKPVPDIAHGTLQTLIGEYKDGFDISYKCDAGYEPTSTSSNIFTCNTSNDDWIGIGLTCGAKEHCVTDSDCLNSGNCISTNCKCQSGFANSNCDTAVCHSSSLPSATHSRPLVGSNNTYIQDSKVIYECEKGYELRSGYQDSVLCKASTHMWEGKPGNCTAIKTCSNGDNCLNGGTCDQSTHQCNCVSGRGNTNCDTVVCGKNLPAVTHAGPDNPDGIFIDGFELKFVCDKGYTLPASSPNTIVCDVASNTWNGQTTDCTAIEKCTNHTDCLHGGSCTSPTRRCDCTKRWGNTNCDTAVCSEHVHTMEHVTLVPPTDADFIDGFNISYTCNAGYEPTLNSFSTFTCDATNNAWTGAGFTCVAKEFCDNSSDCLNGGSCQTNQTCDCAEGFQNTNCDTPVPPLCDWKSVASRAREVVKKGKTSCYCTVRIPGSNSTKRLQIIKRRPVMTMSQIITAAGMGAGGMAGGMAVAIVIYIVVQKLKKGTPGKRPLPTKSPRTIRVSPRT